MSTTVKEKYEAKAGAHEAVVELVAGALENGEFKDLSELELKEVGKLLKRLEKAVTRNFEYAENPPPKREKKPEAPRRGIREEITLDVSQPDFEVSKRRRVRGK